MDVARAGGLERSQPAEASNATGNGHVGVNEADYGNPRPIPNYEEESNQELRVSQGIAFPLSGLPTELNFSRIYDNQAPSLRSVLLTNQSSHPLVLDLSHSPPGVRWAQIRASAGVQTVSWPPDVATNTVAWAYEDGLLPANLRAVRHLAANLETCTTVTMESHASEQFYVEVQVREVTKASASSCTGTEGKSSSPPSEERVTAAYDLPMTIFVHHTEATGHGQQRIQIPVKISACEPELLVECADADDSSAGRDRVLLLDVGDVVVHQHVVRDVRVTNRSDIECFLQVRVHDGREVNPLIAVDQTTHARVDARPAALAPHEQRIFTLVLEPWESHANFEQTITFENAHMPNSDVRILVRANLLGAASDGALVVLSECPLDFGDCCGGEWTRQLLVLKNAGDKHLDVMFHTDKDADVTFQLAELALQRDSADEGDVPDDGVPLGGTSTSTARAALYETHDSPPAAASATLASNTVDPASKGEAPATPRVPDHIPLVANDSDRDSDISSNASQAGSRVGSPEPRLDLASQSSETDATTHHTSTAASTTSSAMPSGSVPSISPSLNTPAPVMGQRVASYSVSALATSQPRHRRHYDPVAMLSGVGESQYNQLEELVMRPGAQYRIVVSYRPPREPVDSEYTGGRLKHSSFRIYLDYVHAAENAHGGRERREIQCHLRTCTPFISVEPRVVDFGMASVGARMTAQVAITNHSELETRILLRFVSKVLSMYMDEIAVPARQTVELKMEFFPRRINESYRKQITVMNLLNRSNDQILEVRARNVDLQRVSFHSLFYRILTTSGSNFLDFGDVNIHSPSVRSFGIENLCATRLSLEMSVAHPEDLQLYVKAPQLHTTRSDHNRVAALKEQFLETISSDTPSHCSVPTKRIQHTPKSHAIALKRGSRGRASFQCGSSMAFRDRSLLLPLAFLDLAAGSPGADPRRRTSTRKHACKSPHGAGHSPPLRMSGRKPSETGRTFAGHASGVAGTTLAAETTAANMPTKSGVKGVHAVTSAARAKADIGLGSGSNEGVGTGPSTSMRSAGAAGHTRQQTQSPALTGTWYRATRFADPQDVAALDLDALISALEHQPASLSTFFVRNVEAEERLVRTEINLHRALHDAIASGQLIPTGLLNVPPHTVMQVVAVYTPHGSTRPHIQGNARKQDSRIFLRLLEFDMRRAEGLPEFEALRQRDVDELPVRDLMVRSSVCRSMLELGQPHINFGHMDKGDQRERKIWIQNRSEWALRYCIRKSGSIASGDIRLGRGRYGIVPGYGKRGVDFTFSPSLSGPFYERLLVENIADHDNDQAIVLKANVRKVANFAIDPTSLDFGTCSSQDLVSMPESVLLSNTTAKQRTFVVRLDDPDSPMLDVLVAMSNDSATRRALSSEEEEEVETLFQKLKIASRKGNLDKLAKYRDRLTQLGVSIPTAATSPSTEEPAAIPTTPSHDELKHYTLLTSGSAHDRSALTVTIGAQSSHKLLVRVRASSSAQVSSSSIANPKANSTEHQPLDALVYLQIHENKNSDEKRHVIVRARIES